MNEELNHLRPGDCFLVDFDDREDSDVSRHYRSFRGYWLTIRRSEWFQGTIYYYTVYDRKKNNGHKLDESIGYRLKDLAFLPIQDFHQFKRYDQQERPAAPRQGLPNI